MYILYSQKIITHWFSPNFYRIRYRELTDISPIACTIQTVWSSLEEEQKIDFEFIKRNIRYRFDRYQFEFKNNQLIEKIETAHFKIVMVSIVSEQQKERFFSKMMKALNILCLEKIDFSSCPSKMTKFFRLQKPAVMFYNSETRTFHFRNEYSFLERHTIAVYNVNDVFYAIGTKHDYTAKRQYEKMKLTMSHAITTYNFSVNSDKKKIIPCIF